MTGVRGGDPAREPREHLNARGLYARGDLIGAAQREADACDRDGYDLTAKILRDLCARVSGDEAPPSEEQIARSAQTAETRDELHGGGPCGLCGRDPAAGFASINDVWYCHGDDDPEPTCYMRSQSKYTARPDVVGRADLSAVPAPEAAALIREALEEADGWARWNNNAGPKIQDALAALAVLVARDEARQRVLRELQAVLGTGECSVNTCEGCRYETQEAVRLVAELLA